MTETEKDDLKERIRASMRFANFKLKTNDLAERMGLFLAESPGVRRAMVTFGDEAVQFTVIPNIQSTPGEFLSFEVALEPDE